MISKANLKHYAYALLDIGKEENKVDVFKKDLETFASIEKATPGLLKFLSSPTSERPTPFGSPYQPARNPSASP